jgi:hypothetical protein
MGRHSEEEVQKFMVQDLENLSLYLGKISGHTIYLHEKR